MLYTVGYRSLAVDRPPSDPAKYFSWAWEGENGFMKKLKIEYPHISNADAIAVDCMDIGEPRNYLYEHIGEHPDIVYLTAKSQGFRRVVQFVKRQSEMFFEAQSGSKLAIYCICGGGKHRSVSAASNLKAIFKAYGCLANNNKNI